MSRIIRKKPPAIPVPNVDHLPRDIRTGIDSLYRLIEPLSRCLECPQQLFEDIELLWRIAELRETIALDTVVETLLRISQEPWPLWQNKRRGWPDLAARLQRDIETWRQTRPPKAGWYPPNRP